MTLHFVKDQKGVDKRRESVLWGDSFPPPVGQYWSLTEDGDRDPGSYGSCPQIRVTGRCWGSLGKEHLLCERVGKSGSNP